MAKKPTPDQIEVLQIQRRADRERAKASDAAAREAEAVTSRRRVEAEATAREAEVTADRRKAEAEAEASRIESETRQREAALRAKLDREAGLRSPLNQARQLALNIGGAVVGLAAGHRMSKKIDARHQIASDRANAALKHAAADARTAMRSDAALRAGGSTAMATLRGAVKAADKAKLLRVAGPMALVKVGVLASEAALARLYFEPKAGSDTERDIWKGVGNAGTFAAGGLLADRLIARATPHAIPNGRDAATIEKARALIKAPPLVAAPVVGTQRKPVRVAAGAATTMKDVNKTAPQMQAAVTRNSVAGKVLAGAAKAGGRVAGLAILASGAIALGSRLLGGGSAEAAQPATTWTDRNGKVYHRTPAGLAALKSR